MQILWFFNIATHYMPSENVFPFYNIPDYIFIIMIHVEYVY